MSTVREDKCQHFTGVQNKTCKAGCSYETFRGGPLPCLPSLQRSSSKPVVAECPKYLKVTPEQIAAREALIQESMRKFEAAGPVVSEFRKANKGRSNQTSVDCPACGTGKLHMSISSYNGHVHGRCTTPNCLAWME